MLTLFPELKLEVLNCKFFSAATLPPDFLRHCALLYMLAEVLEKSRLPGKIGNLHKTGCSHADTENVLQSTVRSHFAFSLNFS
jgi:hypothetical protein